jgi:UDP-N-acetylglucosamine 2-epimerase (non-hydrolysing)
VPVAHVEAGLRSGDVSAPYPEELNRRLISQLAALHLAPTGTARAALLAEGIDPAQVVVTGNTVVDALHEAIRFDVPYGDPALADLDGDPRPLLLVTAHRRESWGQGMRAIGQALADLAALHPDLLIVLPVHPNPVVRETLLPAVAGIRGVRVVEPLAYGGFARLLARSHVILTDSGGIQEEGPSLGKPVLVMRDTTERPEAVEAGTARLVGSARKAIVAAVHELLTDSRAYERMATAVNPYGDGRAAGRVERAIARQLGFPALVEEFVAA